MALVGDSYEYYDKRFYDLTAPIAQVEELYGGCRWAEGPVWFNEHATLVWSDIPNQRLLRWTEGVGVSEFRSRSNFANGNTRDRQGRLVSCEHGEEGGGSIVVLYDRRVPEPGEANGRYHDGNKLIAALEERFSFCSNREHFVHLFQCDK